MSITNNNIYSNEVHEIIGKSTKWFGVMSVFIYLIIFVGIFLFLYFIEYENQKLIQMLSQPMMQYVSGGC